MDSADVKPNSTLPMPQHVGFILDGNRRWIKNKKITGLAHRFGADKVEDLIDWSYDLGIKTITLYVLSTENLIRNYDYLEQLFELMYERLTKLYNDPNLHKRKIRVTAMGNLRLLPDKVQVMFEKLHEETSGYKGQYVNFAVAYGGRQEIVDAVKKISVKISNGSLVSDDIDEKIIESHLYTSQMPHPYPDMVIRTAGDQRLSGFLLWQCAYSELVFLDIMWPEFKKEDFSDAIKTYHRRTRRFGR